MNMQMTLDIIIFSVGSCSMLKFCGCYVGFMDIIIFSVGGHSILKFFGCYIGFMVALARSKSVGDWNLTIRNLCLLSVTVTVKPCLQQVITCQRDNIPLFTVVH